MHQRVLRKCVPSAAEIRLSSARQYRARYHPGQPHLYETRLQAVIRNIRMASCVPSLDDFNFVLEQFAAVGHYLGAYQVLKEMAYLQVQPRTRTYGLCLQAMAHRLQLPCADDLRPHLVRDITKICKELVSDMWTKQIPFVSANVDLVIRILRESSDEEGFDRLIKFGYGIDLSFPDKLPLEFSMREGGATAEEKRDERQSLLQPLSTSGLNTIIDMLGRTSRISKMVVAFEVLTQPLPQTSNSSPSPFDDDDDDSVFPSHSSLTQPCQYPHAKPNITTFNMLIKHASRAGHVVLARHYTLQAMYQDRVEDRRLRGDVMRFPLDSIVAPNLSVNRGTILPVFGEANRDKNVELTRFTLKAILRALRRKYADIRYYTEWKARRLGHRTDSQETAQPEGPANLSSPSEPDVSETPAVPDPSIIESVADSAVPSASFTPSDADETSSQSVPDTDLDNSIVFPPLPPKIFNFDLHLSILRRDKAELEELEDRVNLVLGRTAQRVKERLGRRVWANKTIYLATEGHRLHVPRERWKGIVRFKDARRTQPHNTPAVHVNRGI